VAISTIERANEIRDKDDRATFINRKILMLENLHKKSNFLQSPLSIQFFKQYQVDDDDFRKAYNQDQTRNFYRYIYFKSKHFEPINLSLYGLQRGGKSSVGISLALDIAKITSIPFPLDSSFIYKNPSTFLKDIPNFKKQETKIIDEQKIKKTGIGSFAESWEIEDLSHIAAKLAINFIWISPVLFTERDSEYALKVIGICRETCLTKCLLLDLKNSEDGFFRMFGFCVFQHYDLSVNRISPEQLIKLPDNTLKPEQLLRKNYEIRKDIWIKEIQSRFTSDRAIHRLEEAIKLTQNEMYQKCKNSKQRITTARILLPEGYVEEELDEIVNLTTSPELLFDLLAYTKNQNAYKEPLPLVIGGPSKKQGLPVSFGPPDNGLKNRKRGKK